MPQSPGFRLKEKVVLITGASRGIGRASVKAFVTEGAHVFACARSLDQLQKIAEACAHLPGKVSVIACDVRNIEAILRMMQRVQQDEGRLDLLVNNAGILGPRCPIEDIDLYRWQTTLAVNLNGVFSVTKAALPLLREAEDAKVFNLSSSVGRKGRAGWGAYAVSKFGVEGLTEILAAELADSGITVVSINPGGTATGMRSEAYPEEDPASLPAPDAVASTLLHWAMNLDRSQTGAKLSSRELLPQL